MKRNEYEIEIKSEINNVIFNLIHVYLNKDENDEMIIV